MRNLYEHDTATVSVQRALYLISIVQHSISLLSCTLCPDDFGGHVVDKVVVHIAAIELHIVPVVDRDCGAELRSAVVPHGWQVQDLTSVYYALDRLQLGSHGELLHVHKQRIHRDPRRLARLRRRHDAPVCVFRVLGVEKLGQLFVYRLIGL